MAITSDSVKFRYKGEKFSSDNADEILVGVSYSVENEESYNALASESELSPSFNEISYDNSIAAEAFNPSKIYEKMIKSAMTVVIIFASVFFLREILQNTSTFSYSIDKSTMFFIGLYFLMFVAGILFFTKKKKIKIELRNGFLFINSFPSLNQKIPVERILSCKVNVLKSRNREALQIPLNEEGAYSFNLNSGIVVTLVNGKSLFIGSSNS